MVMYLKIWFFWKNFTLMEVEMKKVILMLVCIIFVGMYQKVEAGVISVIEVNFSFNAPTDGVRVLIGFKLYESGVAVIVWDDADVYKREVIMSLPENRTAVFTLTALYDDGTESPTSPEYLFDIGNTRPAPVEEFQRISTIFGSTLMKGMEVTCGKLS